MGERIVGRYHLLTGTICFASQRPCAERTQTITMILYCRRTAAEVTANVLSIKTILMTVIGNEYKDLKALTKTKKKREMIHQEANMS